MCKDLIGNSSSYNDYVEDSTKTSRVDCLTNKDVIGWICPVCGSGLSLLTSRCPCVPLKME